MLQAQNPKLVCQPLTTTHSFRQAIEKSHSFASINSYTSGVSDGIAYNSDGYSSADNDGGLTFKVESHHFLTTHLYRSISAYKQQPQLPSVQRSVSNMTDS